MGEIVGAAIVSHIPPIAMSLEFRRSIAGGRDDISLVPGLHRLRAECLDRLRPDTIVVIDSHWFTTFEFVVSAHGRRSGRFTSSELPRGMVAVPYDYPGDPELADALAAAADRRDDAWIHATRDPYVEVFYPVINLLPYLQGPERWTSMSLCQTAEVDDFLRVGELLAEAVASVDRRVVILASGALSHTFWPLRTMRAHEDIDPENITTSTNRAADARMIALFEKGDHAGVLDDAPTFRRENHPEGWFGHVLTMLGALGGPACTARGIAYSDYESAAGTGNIHLWFECPVGGWTGDNGAIRRS
jgi:aromatic ring-opening dioxygenase catalytic subunit (LigB family)